MAPQPLSYVKRDARIEHRPMLLTARPQAALVIANCINMWSNVELQLGFMMISFLGEVAIPTVAIYTDLLALRTRLSALRSAAQYTLEKEEFELFEALAHITTKAVKSRDKLAHHIWTYSDDIDDHLLVIDPKDLLPAFAVGVGKVIRQETVDGKAFLISDVQIPHERVFVYKVSDLEDMLSEFIALHNYLSTFNTMVLSGDVGKQQILYSSLSQQPPIAKALARQNANQNTTATHQQQPLTPSGDLEALPPEE